MAGSVFKNVAERTMALKSNRSPMTFDIDSTCKKPQKPYTKVGYYNALQTVMTDLKLPLENKSAKWVKTVIDSSGIKLESIAVSQNGVPNLHGMGAKDAVYLAERLGLNVQVQGRGKLVEQSLKAGIPAKKGQTILLKFE